MCCRSEEYYKAWLNWDAEAVIELLKTELELVELAPCVTVIQEKEGINLTRLGAFRVVHLLWDHR